MLGADFAEKNNFRKFSERIPLITYSNNPWLLTYLPKGWFPPFFLFRFSNKEEEKTIRQNRVINFLKAGKFPGRDFEQTFRQKIAWALFTNSN